VVDRCSRTAEAAGSIPAGSILKSELGIYGIDLESLGRHKLEKLRKLVSSLIKTKKKRSKHTKYGNINKGFTEEELKRFLSSCKPNKAYLAFFLMSHLGLRVREVTNVKFEDIDWVNNKLRISTLKAKTGDFLFMPIEVRKLLLNWVRRYTNEIKAQGGYILFSSNPVQKRQNISPNWLRREFRDTCMLCNLDEWYEYAEDEKNPQLLKNRKLHRLTTHSLRHYFITKCYNHCKNPILTQKLARHTDYRSTQVYINVDYEKMGRIIEDVFEPETNKEKEELVEFMEFYRKWKDTKRDIRT
jgi:integrase